MQLRLIKNSGQSVRKSTMQPCLLLCFVVSFFITLQALEAQNITRPNISGPSGLQVNSYTGELFFQRTDFFLPGRGLSLDITFSYNSADRAMNWGFGYGWTFTYNRFYAKDSLGNVAFYNGDGREDLYKVKEGAFVAPVGVFDKASEYEPGKFRLRAKDGTQYFFDDPAHRKLTKIRDRNDNEVVLSYSGSNLSTITDPSGRSLSFVWTSDRLTEIKADFGSPAKSIKYTYDDAGSLITVKDPMGYIQTYSYGRNRLLSGYIDKNGNTNSISYNLSNAVTKLVSCTRELMITYNTTQIKTNVTEKNNGGNQITTYVFDSTGRLSSREGNCCGFKNAFTYDEYNNINSQIDANGNKKMWIYDKRGNLLSETDPLDRTIFYTYDTIFNKVVTTKDKNGSTTMYKYDIKGNLIEESKPLNISIKHFYDDKGSKVSTTDGKGNTTTLNYDPNGYLKTITDPSGGLVQLVYDSWGNLVNRIDQNNNVTAFEYDALSRLITIKDALSGESKVTYDGNSNITSLTDANSIKTIYLYNALNKVVLIKDVEGNSTSLNYDAVGNLTARTSPLGGTISFSYDNLNRLVSQSSPTGEQTLFEYDGNGNTVSINFPNGNRVVSTFDPLNRLIEIKDNFGLLTAYSYDPNSNILTQRNGKGQITSYSYDALNRILSQVDPLGNTYAYEYDKNSNLIRSLDRNGNSINHTYDVLNREISIINALGHKTSFTYDKVSNLIEVIDANDNSTQYLYDALKRLTGEQFADNTKRTYVYDAVDNLISRKDNNGAITEYKFNGLNQLVARKNPSFSDSFYYDASGRLIKAINIHAIIGLTYDADDRIINETLNGKSTIFTYNTTTGIKKVTYPNGRSIEKIFDVRNRLSKIRDQNGFMLADFVYDASGMLMQKNYANSTVSRLEYNGINYLASLSTMPSNLLNFNYQYDKEGNPITIQQKYFNSSPEQYSYDKQKQLIEFSKGGVLLSKYNYDGVGNRISVQAKDRIETYSVNNMNAYTSVMSDSIINFSYDLNGNLTSDGKRSYTYDTESRMISVDNGSTATYTYDPFGRRIKKTTQKDTINYYFDGYQVIEERSSIDHLKKSYIWGGWIDDIICVDREGSRYYYHSNSLGSINSISDSVGRLVERYDYDPFGKITLYSESSSVLTSSIVDNTYFYTTREYDQETGLYYYRARQYDPHYGRFLQRDPLGYEDGMCLYTYVSNRPTVLIDPMGTEGISACSAKHCQAVAARAKSYVNAKDWSRFAVKDNFSRGDYKCNKFVYDVLTQEGIGPGTPNKNIVESFLGIGGFPPTAGQWADPNYSIPNWEILQPGETPEPGDVIALNRPDGTTTGHVGIVVAPGLTVSQKSPDDKIIQNDWGFRSTDRNIVIRRYRGK